MAAVCYQGDTAHFVVTALLVSELTVNCALWHTSLCVMVKWCGTELTVNSALWHTSLCVMGWPYDSFDCLLL